MAGSREYDASIEDQAAYWLVRLSTVNCTPEDRFAFEAWKQEDLAHEAMYIRLQKGNAIVDRNMTDPRIQTMLDEARVRDEGWRLSLGAWWRDLARPRAMAAAVAAAAVLSVVGILSMSQFFSNHSLQSQIAETEVFDTLETTVGERSTVTLADDSVVALNTNSRLEVRFSEAERLVRLVRGQAFFEVSEDIDRPFVVEAGDKRVVALGTSFDVRFDRDDQVEVTLVEGRVEVDDRVLSGAGVLPGVNTAASVELSPGERLIAKLDLAPEVIETDTVEETSWRTGQLVFRRRPLESVVEEMNRYSTQVLVLSDDPRVQELMVSGIFNAGGRASSFVNALEGLYPLQAERTGAQELTLVWRE